MTKRYFKVEAKCGHVGHGKCIWITFATAADNGKEAAKKVRDFKRVKHDHKDAIGSVKEISFEEFIAIKAANDADPYLHCKNVQEQRKILDFDKRVVDDKRELRARLTQKGREIDRHGLEKIKETDAIALAGLDEDEQATLMALLGKIRQNLLSEQEREEKE